MNKSVYRYILIAVLVLCVAGGASAQNGDSVVVQLNWIHDSAWAPFYMAQDEGFYADAGLDVELNLVFDDEGNFIDVVDEVASGRAQFGVVDAGTLLNARANDIPVVAIATLYQRHPLAFTSLADANIVSPFDFVGKTAHISENSLFMFQALLASLDIDPADVNIVERTDYSIAPLTSGEADIIDAWVTNEISILTVQGIEFNAVYPFEYGIDMYANLIITSEEYAESSADVVQSFLAATVDGIQAAIDDITMAAESTVARDSNLVLEEQQEALFRSVPLFAPAGASPGMMEADVWAIGHEILVDESILTGEVDLEAAYTMDFLTAIYGE